MRPFGSPKTLERRRRKAIAFLQRGMGVAHVARRIGSSISSVLRWKEIHESGGDQALAPKPVSGRPRKLKEKEIQRLLKILLNGALANGFPNEIWTLKRIARVIQKEFGVEYHQGHVWKILRRFHWSCQVPERRALQRDEQAIEHWKRYKWPVIKKKGPRTWRPSGFPR